MQYLISLALLVAVAAWLVGVYNNLEHLRGVVCNCWMQWSKMTHYRNECLRSFVPVLASFMPEESPLPRLLLALVADSEHSLAESRELRWGPFQQFSGRTESRLRKAVAESVLLVEASPLMREHNELLSMCSNVSASLYQQEQIAALFNRAVREYNKALSSPSARFLGPVFGFVAAFPLDAMQHAQNARNS